MGTAESFDALAASVMMTGLPGTSLDGETRAMIERGVRSFILFGRNIEDTRQLRSLCAEIREMAGPDAIIAIDHEGGRVNRLRGVATSWPSPMGWAAVGDADLVRRASAVMAGELAALGINLNFAPVADLLGSYRNPVLSTRCFSDRPADVARYVGAFIEGHREAGVASTAKHFPGHGDTPVDSHVDLPTVSRPREQLLEEDLIPFKAAIEAQVPCLMVSHVWYSQLDREPTPATLSAAVTQLARGDLHFDGLIVTDSLEMGAIRTRMTAGDAVVEALRAGADMVMVSHGEDRQASSISAIARAAGDGHLPAARLSDARRRIGALRTMARYGEDMPGTGEALAEEIARRGVTLVRNEGNTLPVRLDAEERLGVVTFSAPRGSLVEDEAGLPPLAAALARRASIVHVSLSPEDAPDDALAPLRGVDTVVVGTAHAVGRAWQAETVNRLLDAGKRVIPVALADPFDLLTVPGVPAFLAAYSDVPASVGAAAAILLGERGPEGHLPVELPGFYPQYHGLSL